MKNLLCLVAVLFIFSCATRQEVLKPPPEEVTTLREVLKPPPEEVTTLTGEWREIRNQQMPVIQEKTWLFRGHTITIDDGQNVYTGTFSCDDSADPKEIDFRFEGHPVNQGLYKIDGNMLTIKVMGSSPDRPQDLKYEKGYTLIVCRKEK